MRHSAALGAVLVALVLPCSSALASPPSGIGALGSAAGEVGDLPRSRVASPEDLGETTGVAAVSTIGKLSLLDPEAAIDAIGDLGDCALDQLTSSPSDAANLVTGPARTLGCVVGEATGAAAGVVSGAAAEVAGGIADQWTKSVLEGTSWLLRSVATAIDRTTSPNVDAAWFRGTYKTMGAIALLLAAPLLFISLGTALARMDGGQAIRSALVSLPMAFLLSACALTLTQFGLAITDWASAAVAQTVEEPGGRFLASTSKVISYDALVAGTAKLPTFVALGAGLLAFLCGVVVWVELIIRDAAVYLCAFFLPLAFAGAIWPRTARAARRIVGLLVAAVLSKFVIVAVLSLAGRAAFAGVPEQGIEPLLAAIAMLLLAVAAPAALLALVPLLDDAGGDDGLRRGLTQAAGRLPVPGPRDVLRNVAREHSRGGNGRGAGGTSGALTGLSTTGGGTEVAGAGATAASASSPAGDRSDSGVGVAGATRPRPAESAVGRVVDVAEGRGTKASPLRAQPSGTGPSPPSDASSPLPGTSPAAPAAAAPSPPRSPSPRTQERPSLPPEAEPQAARPDTWTPEPPA